MTTTTRLTLKREIDLVLAAVLSKAKHDKFFPHAAEIGLRSMLYDGWTKQVNALKSDLYHYNVNRTFSAPSLHSVGEILHIMSSRFSGSAITRHLYDAPDKISLAFDKGKEQVNAQYKKQVGKSAIGKGLLFGFLFGLTEDHALQALNDQLTLSAGGFWDEQMTDSIRKELESWFGGEVTENSFGTLTPLSREQLASRLQKLVNDRLSIEGGSSKPRSYFDGLSEHLVVRSRNVGSLYRAESLGSTQYRIQNVMDARTSTVCHDLVESRRLFTVAGARDTVTKMLQADSLGELKAAVPFINSAGEAKNPVPPIHWRCRSWQEFVFEGLG